MVSLDLRKLTHVRTLPDGGAQARCPACAEGGHDRKGEHLRVYPDGRFGCCVYPKDREHRKRIHALAGNHGPQAIRVKVASANTAAPLKAGVLGRLGRLFETPEQENSRTADQFGTAGTPFSYLRAYAREDVKRENIYRDIIGFDQSVPSVPTAEERSNFENPVPSVPEGSSAVAAASHAEPSEMTEEDLERKMNETPY